MQVLRAHGLAACSHTVGELNTADEIRVWRNARPLLKEKARRPAARLDGNQPPDRPTARRRAMRAGGIRFIARRGRSRAVRHTDLRSPAEDIAAPMIAKGARPKIAILREQGVNGQVEMAAAFDRAGFARVDVHMSDLQSPPCRAD
jgi:phosphoribosylformylglycinamidine synthase